MVGFDLISAEQFACCLNMSFLCDTCGQNMHRLQTDAAAIIEASLEVKLPTIWRDEKTVSREKNQKKKKSEKQMQVREKVGKSRNTVFFGGFVAPEG